METACAKGIQTQWSALPERGTPTALRSALWVALHIGRRVARLLLYPIAFHYLLAAGTARRASYDFLRRLRGEDVHWWQVWRHFHSFAATILDRVYLLRGEFERFNVTLHRRELLHQQVESGVGCILLGSHLGSFEILRTLGVTQQDFPLKVLMDTGHNPNVTRLLDALNPQIAGTVIPPDAPDALLRVREALDRGFLVGTLGDRVLAHGRAVTCDFLGAPASFPIGPIVMAATMHCPIILFFGLYQGGNRYDVYFEKFADNIVLEREQRHQQIQAWVQKYADRLEYYLRLAPYNWFNFYDFWAVELSPTSSAASSR